MAADAAYTTMKAEIGGKQEILREKQKFLDEQKANNVQVEARIGYADRQLAKVRAQYSLVQNEIVEYPLKGLQKVTKYNKCRNYKSANNMPTILTANLCSLRKIFAC